MSNLRQDYVTHIDTAKRLAEKSRDAIGTVDRNAYAHLSLAYGAIAEPARRDRHIVRAKQMGITEIRSLAGDA